MGKYKVIMLKGLKENAIGPATIQNKINEMVEAGYRFVQMSGPGIPVTDYYMPTWVYLIFESQD